MVEFAKEEISELEAQIADLEVQLKLLLLPRDPLDERDIMLEIRWAADCVRVLCVVCVCCVFEVQLKLLLLPRDPLDERDIMLEIRWAAAVPD